MRGLSGRGVMAGRLGADRARAAGAGATLALAVHHIVRMVQADAALRRLAENGIGRFRIGHAMSRDFPQLLFLDGIADANDHDSHLALLRDTCKTGPSQKPIAGFWGRRLRMGPAFASHPLGALLAIHSQAWKACFADAAVLKPGQLEMPEPRR